MVTAHRELSLSVHAVLEYIWPTVSPRASTPTRSTSTRWHCPRSLSSTTFVAAMGLVDEAAAKTAHHFLQLGTGAQIGVAVLAFLTVSVVVNVAQQLLFKNPNEPPVVFHLFPVIGSTITYGMDPPRFFKENREKVRLTTRGLPRPFICSPQTACGSRRKN